jgi:hypothetical protein
MPDIPRSLIAYLVGEGALTIRPAPIEREWMDATGERFAYRCLPLNIANSHGWEILSPVGFAAGWTGGPGVDALVIQTDGGAPAPASSHFGGGILTFHVPTLFQTEPGYDLWVQGPVNRPKDGIYALTGVVETDWSPFTFTMNWVFTRSGALLRFEKDEPICHIFPVKRGELEALSPRVAPIDEAPELKARYDAWSASRGGFNAELKTPGSDAQAQRWQKNYYRGQDSEGVEVADDDHRTRLRLRPFRSGGGD